MCWKAERTNRTFVVLKAFLDHGLAAPLVDALAREGYETPTPIQAQAIPSALEGRDLLGTAQTGTGKTAAFTLPILQHLMPAADHPGKRPIRVLILTPTRELALQIDESIGTYGANVALRHAVIFGGVGQKPQTDTLRRGVDLLTATPGRLLDLMNQGFVDLRHLTHFVLDEADRMLDMGFIHDVKKVIAKLPSKRQTLFFSATMPKEVVVLSDQLLNNPVRVAVAPVSTTAETVQQKVFFVDQKTKRFLLKELLENSANEIPSVLVFTRTKHGADRVVKDLVRANITAQAIHGNKSQNARQNALKNFKSRETRVLVATDIAARGIDIDELTHVINFEIPNIPETYVHRIGRTGRAGHSGVAWSFVDADERSYLKDIQRLIKMDIPVEKDHAFLPGTKVEGSSEPEPREERRSNQSRPSQGRPSRTRNPRGRSNGPRSASVGGSKERSEGQADSRNSRGKRSDTNATGEPGRTPRPSRSSAKRKPQGSGGRPQRSDNPLSEKGNSEFRAKPSSSSSKSSSRGTTYWGNDNSGTGGALSKSHGSNSSRGGCLDRFRKKS